MNGTELAFSPDGTKILGRSSPDSALDGWFVMDIESGVATPLDVPPDATRLLAAGRAALTADMTAAGPPGGGSQCQVNAPRGPTPRDGRM